MVEFARIPVVIGILANPTTPEIGVEDALASIKEKVSKRRGKGLAEKSCMMQYSLRSSKIAGEVLTTTVRTTESVGKNK